MLILRTLSQLCFGARGEAEGNARDRNHDALMALDRKSENVIETEENIEETILKPETLYELRGLSSIGQYGI